MKSISQILIIVLLALAASASAQSPREQFQAAVAAYQQNTTEANVEKLAGLYKQVTPPPAVPEQAEFHAQKGAAFARLAKTPADFERAAKEFQAAINIAPWISEYHYNLAICYKSAEQFNPALASLRFAQILAHDEKARRDTLGLRAEIEAAQEMAASQKVERDKVAAAAVRKAQEQTDGKPLLDSLEGAIFDHCNERNTSFTDWVEIRNGEAMMFKRRKDSGDLYPAPPRRLTGKTTIDGVEKYVLTPENFTWSYKNEIMYECSRHR